MQSNSNDKKNNINKLWEHRQLFYFLTLRDIKVRYKQALGLLYTFYPQSFTPSILKLDSDFVGFLNQTIQKTIAETIPWYWGVFNWLGVTYPRIVYQIINRVMLIAAIGVLIKLYIDFKSKSKEGLLVIFLLLSSLIYFFGVTYYNYLFSLGSGFSFGIQGRYFFPVVVAHMALILVGVITLVPSRYKKAYIWAIKLLGLGMIILTFIALYTIAGSYYDLSSMNNFIVQGSQYKPWFYKGNWLIFWLVGYLLATFLLMREYLKLDLRIIRN